MAAQRASGSTSRSALIKEDQRIDEVETKISSKWVNVGDTNLGNFSMNKFRQEPYIGQPSTTARKIIDSGILKVFFWSLPSCAGNLLRQAHSKLEADLESAKKRRAELDLQRESLQKGREDSVEREVALNDLKKIEKEYRKLKEELECYADNDPTTVEAMRNAIEVAHEAANRWTDNIFALQHWCSSNFPEAKEQLEHLYREVGITESFDYLE